MKWPWSKKVKNDIIPNENDWVKKTDNWSEVTICHCGTHKKWGCFSIFNYIEGEYTVCPKCGHKDKWITQVIRHEWEESPSRKKYLESICESSRRWDEWHRNQHTVIWTPGHCTVKDENDPGR